MLSRTHLRQFLAVVDTGSFTRAAGRINVAQPTLSAGIAELERQLGTRLFIREKRRIRLTEAANRLLPHARSIEREFRMAETSAADLPIPLRPIRLGVLESFPTDRLERAIARYQGEEPVELIEGSERELQVGIANGGIDLALSIVRPQENRFAAYALFEDGYRLALSDRHPLADRIELDPDAVAGERMIARRSCELLGETSRFFTERGIRPPFSLRSANDDRVMAMVAAGLGITVAPESLGRPGVSMPRLAGFDYARTIGLLFGGDWKAHYGDSHPLPAAFPEQAPIPGIPRKREGSNATLRSLHE